MIRRALTAVAIAALSAGPILAAQVPLRGDFPAGSGEDRIPVAGGIPFPQGGLGSIDEVRLLDPDGRELPCQATKLAVWPDGSVKWALIEIVVAPAASQKLILEYGDGVARARVEDPLTATAGGSDVRLAGGNLAALVRRNGGGVLDELTYRGRTVVASAAPARLVVNTLRIADGTSGRLLPVNRFVCRDTGATLDRGKPMIDEVMVESAGPVRATVRIRGHLLLPRFGATLPDSVKRREPPGRMPFSMRLSFYRGSAIVYGQHQIVFSGEPDCDYLARWGIQLPGLAGPKGSLTLEPGVTLVQQGGSVSVADKGLRLCWAPIRGGFALIRRGWENRPCAVTQDAEAAWIDFWPREAGVWDLRRYAREWACGESGNTKDLRSIQRFAKFAARGLAKSHNFVIYFGQEEPGDPSPGLVQSLSARALLVAPPSWYASTGALGRFAPEQISGPFASLDASLRRELDFHLYCQDLYRWHGKLDYGNWQSRFGTVHRHDRWDRDYGRWGWALNDGAGRIGHVLMLQFVRTLERRYFVAGEAFNRINYDTNMVHTVQHLENTRSWWTATGCSHRHNVQPFGCPYIGMRGSNPGGHRILHLLTGDGVIRDGLEIVADASYKYLNGQGWRLCNSGGSDGQGSAANALLWKYETTGDTEFLYACRQMLDKSGLIPPESGKRLGYGPSFGLFNAAVEYAEVSGDKSFRERVLKLALEGAKHKKPEQFAFAIAAGYRITRDPALRTTLEGILGKLGAAYGSSLAALPVHRWPGHAGWRTPKLNANSSRDYPYAIGALVEAGSQDQWPKLEPNAKPIPAAPPEDWYRPGGAQTPEERVPPAEEILNLESSGEGGELTAGKVTLSAREGLLDRVTIRGVSPLAGGIVPYVEAAEARNGESLLAAKYSCHIAGPLRAGVGEDGSLIAEGKAGPVGLKARMRPSTVEGVPAFRVELACRAPEGTGRVASWGLLVPLKLGTDAHAIQTTAPGRFRLERCRLDQNDERIPNWQTSEYHHGEGAPLWPKWRQSGISIGPGPFYRIWRANASDVSALFCDQGEGTAAWFDVTDRGARPRWGLTVRLLRPGPVETDLSRLAVRVDLESGLMEIQFHDASAPPLPARAARDGLCGVADLIFHEGWRPPLSRPELTAAQYEKFIDDLNYGENYGLNALRFRLSITHKVRGREWMEKVRDLGIEPREILYGMQWRDSLARHCRKLGVPWDPDKLETCIQKVIERYRK